MEYEYRLPPFDEDWISKSQEIVAALGGIPPNINFFRGDFVTPEWVVIDDEIEEAIAGHVQMRGSDLPSRFAALNYLWTVVAASSASREEDDLAALGSSRSEAPRAMLRLADRLDPDSVSTPEHALWEFKQAFILQSWDRLMRLGQRRRTLEAMSDDDLNLLMGRAFWFPNSRHWAGFVGQLVGIPMKERHASWEAVLGGDRLAVSHAAALPPASYEPQNRLLIVDAIASLRKVSPGKMGPHWGILADCEAMTESPDQCALI